MITLAEYERFVEDNWWSGGSPEYTMIALGGEVGEALNFHKKLMRTFYTADERAAFLKGKRKEFGDALYYLVKACHDAGITLAEIMDDNHTKLVERNEENPR